jgi:catalase
MLKKNSADRHVNGTSLGHSRVFEDLHFLECVTHAEREQILKRIVQARGSAAHGKFRPYKGAAKYTRAAFLQDASIETPVFVRFSTVAGGAGPVDLSRDVRRFATSFYTSDGIFDLVGNNIPGFFTQDEITFPDFVHAANRVPDRTVPNDASAHDTFWASISLAPESLHMVMWVMSDRAIPRSYRMMEGFGVHTFRMVDAKGRATFIKWHWRPVIGTQSVVWDEAVKINGVDESFHRRDLFLSIQAIRFPAWELAIQPIAENKLHDLSADLGADLFDPTKLIREEEIPLVPIGKMVLDRWQNNFFAETEHAAFRPGQLVPGIELVDDPVLERRISSYTDTWPNRLGGSDLADPEICGPESPLADIGPDIGRQPNRSDHYSQARMFWRSMTAPEQRHIASAFSFELSRVETLTIRRRMLGHLDIIDPELGRGVADALGMTGQADTVRPLKPPRDLPPSPSLSILAKAQATLEGRRIGVLIADGFDAVLVDKLCSAVQQAGATFELVAATIGATIAADGREFTADHLIAGSPSVLFDAVAIVPGARAVPMLASTPHARDWVSDAFAHCKVIGTVAAATPLLEAAQVRYDDGVVDLAGQGIAVFVETAKRGRIWAREARA